jgi:hypothetical protein
VDDNVGRCSSTLISPGMVSSRVVDLDSERHQDELEREAVPTGAWRVRSIDLEKEGAAEVRALADAAAFLANEFGPPTASAAI